MKKLFSFMMLVVVVFAMTSCPPQGFQGQGEKMELNYAENYGDFYNAKLGANVYYAQFTTGDLTVNEEGVPSGTGDYIVLEIYSKEDGNLPAMGEYVAPEVGQSITKADVFNDGMLGITLQYGQGYAGSYFYTIENGEIKSMTGVNSGSKAVFARQEDGSITIQLDLVDMDGGAHQYYYQGALNYIKEEVVEKGAYEDEPTTAVTMNNISFPRVDILNQGDALGTYEDVLGVQLISADVAVSAILLAPVNSGADLGRLAHAYTISDSYDEYTALKSVGTVDKLDYPTYVVTGENGSYTTIYYIVSGSISIEDNRVSCNLTSYNGSKFSGSYEGTVTVSDKSGMPVYAKRFNAKDARSCAAAMADGFVLQVPVLK